MRTHLDIFIEGRDVLPSGYVQPSGAAVLRVTDRLALYMGDVEPAAWLRSLALAAEDLAEQIDLAAACPGETLAMQHMAEAMAAAGIGGQ